MWIINLSVKVTRKFSSNCSKSLVLKESFVETTKDHFPVKGVSSKSFENRTYLRGISGLWDISWIGLTSSVLTFFNVFYYIINGLKRTSAFNDFMNFCMKKNRIFIAYYCTSPGFRLDYPGFKPVLVLKNHAKIREIIGRSSRIRWSAFLTGNGNFNVLEKTSKKNVKTHEVKPLH